jgi:hypothetical protein
LKLITERKVKGVRLTWDGRFPYPYESLWSVITKVAIYNAIEPSELVSLIKRPDVLKIRLSQLDLFDTRWIDFERFAALLDVDVNRLVSGSLASLGIAPPQRGYMVRQCPKCWAAGYHCVLFDFASLSSCPFHGCAFTRPCDACALQGFRVQRLRSTASAAHRCSRCGLGFHDRHCLLEIAEQRAVNWCEFEGKTRSFSNWWCGIGRRFPFRDAVLGDLVRALEFPEHSYDFLPWKLFLAQKLSDDLIPLEFSPVPEHADYAELKFDLDKSLPYPNAAPLEDRIDDICGRSYRSLRTHIYKRYVKSHHSCYKNLKRLNYYDCVSLSYDNVCIVCLSFVIWRMAIERLVRIEGLSHPRPGEYTIKLTGPNLADHFSVEEKLRWAYFTFLSIWKSLESHRGQVNIRIENSNYQLGKDLFFKRVIAKNESVVEPGINEGVYCVLYPNIEELLEKELERCQARKKRGGDFLDGERRYQQDSLLDLNRSGRRQEIMFELRNPENIFTKKHAFREIYV